MNSELIELEASYFHKVIFINKHKLRDPNIYNKLSFLICIGDKEIISNMSRIEFAYSKIDKAIIIGNYRRALRYSWYLKKFTDKLISEVNNKSNYYKVS